MTPSSAATSLVKNSEGLQLKAYRCPAGVWTIGYGHTAAVGLPEVSPGKVITAQEAEDILAADLELVGKAVLGAVKVPLTQAQFDALVSFVFNVGSPKFRGSTLLRRLNAHDYVAVPSQLLLWTHCEGKVLPGLVARRHAEAAMWDGMAVGLPHAGPVPKVVHAAPAARSLPHPTPVVIASAGVGGGATAAASQAHHFPDLTGWLHLAADPRFWLPLGGLAITLGLVYLNERLALNAAPRPRSG